ncbi:hypothetical protein GE061_006833 [Apolygus lucorum]|uniref:Uncharacterized protein n=1 Tax=Apolygus lucorum TaxID=248454 RepID=A0A6A4J887_APOLU|nr:hypothetical protein GE061_006833 [Apolygus lucorum]
MTQLPSPPPPQIVQQQPNSPPPSQQQQTRAYRPAFPPVSIRPPPSLVVCVFSSPTKDSHPNGHVLHQKFVLQRDSTAAKMGFCSCTIKLLLFIFNLVCALVGLAILSFAVYFYLQTHSVKDFAAGYVSITTIIMMVLGGVTFIVAFLGCCGAVNEDPCCISSYATLLSIILVCQLVLAGFFVYFAQGGDVEKSFRKQLESDYDNYKNNPGTIDLLQTTFRCCGYNGPATFVTVSLPPSCCPKQSESDRNIGTTIAQSFGVSCSVANAYKDGCANKITDLIKGTGKNGSIVLFVIAGVELVCIVAAFCIANSIRRERVATYAY